MKGVNADGQRGLYLLTSTLAIIFVSTGALFPEQLGAVMQKLLDTITARLGWMYLVIVLGFVVFCLFLAFSKFGKILLGEPGDKPEYSTFSWFAMLFSAGMGIGLVFWSVGEPLSHLSGPPVGQPFSQEAIQVAMRYTFFHWGIHPWAVYGIVGLSMAYFSFRNKAPLLISSTFKPLLGERIHGWPGKALDGLAVLATIFGVATSLGLGTLQITSGLNYLFNIPSNIWTSVIVIVVITVLFTISTITGIRRGIRVLSNTNLIIALTLFFFMVLVGPAQYIVGLMISSTGDYFKHFISMSLALEPTKNSGWVNSWTVFYWAWWIAWAPFVGGFIARISRGRTIRQFIFGVLIAPVILSFLWMGTFGGAALHLQSVVGVDIASRVLEDVSTGLFVVLDHYPLSGIFSGLALVLITVFFITSADSATFVIGMLLSRGSLEPSTGIKVFWGVMQGGIAIVLLLTGGLVALQTASIVAAFPFMLVMLFMVYALVRQLSKEKAEV